jgi:hypothetical protein
MTPEERARLAKGLSKNRLLPAILDARADDIRETWESEESAEGRELLWLELKVTKDLRDFIYARIDEYCRGAGTE